MPECNHEFVESPFLAYMSTECDGPNYRCLNLEMCKNCGILRAPKEYAGFDTWEEYREEKMNQEPA